MSIETLLNNAKKLDEFFISIVSLLITDRNVFIDNIIKNMPPEISKLEMKICIYKSTPGSKKNRLISLNDYIRLTVRTNFSEMIANITKTIISNIPTSSNELGEETIGNSDSNNFNRSTEQIQDDAKI